MIAYNKLVRDNIPNIIKQNDIKCKYHIAKDDTEYLTKLYEKLQEEIAEFKEKPSIEEFVDILEVMEAIAKFHNYHLNHIKEVKAKKKLERGSFDNRIILEES